jgi:hypothetical protein
MGELVQKMQTNIKQSSTDIFVWLLKIISGAVLALTVSLIIQEIMGKKEGEAPLSFLFMILVFTAIFLRVAKKWNMIAVLVFDLVCVLVGMVLCLYIMVAPGA